MKKTALLTIFILIFVGYGCTSIQKRQKEISKPKVREYEKKPRLDINELKNRVDELNEYLRLKELSHSEEEAAVNLIRAYEWIKRNHSYCPDMPCCDEIDEIFKSIYELDKFFFSGDRSGSLKGLLGKIQKQREELLGLYLRGDFKGVINQWDRIKMEFGREAMGPIVKLVLALSYGKEGELEKALEIGEDLVNQIKPLPDLMYFRSKMAQWQLQLGKGDEALQIYERLGDDLNEKEEAILSLKKKITGSDSSVIKMPKTEDSLSKELTPLEKVLVKANALTINGNYDEAKILLVRYKIKSGEKDTIEKIEAALQSIERIQQEQKTEGSGLIEEDNLHEIKELINEGKYEDALHRLEGLEKAEGLDRESTSLKQEALEKVINRERNRAAKLFLEAKESEDPGTKRDKLMSSLEILNNILEKYPTSHLNKRIKSHIDRIQNELDKLENSGY